MRTRILPPEEWPRLKGTEAETAWPVFDPENTQVIAIEEDGEIVSTWTAMRLVHMECIWVKPSHRGRPSVVVRLLRGMREAAARWGARAVLTSSLSPEITDLIERFGGVPLPGQMFAMPTEIRNRRKEEACLPQSL